MPCINSEAGLPDSGNPSKATANTQRLATPLAVMNLPDPPQSNRRSQLLHSRQRPCAAPLRSQNRLCGVYGGGSSGRTVVALSQRPSSLRCR